MNVNLKLNYSKQAHYCSYIGTDKQNNKKQFYNSLYLLSHYRIKCNLKPLIKIVK